VKPQAPDNQQLCAEIEEAMKNLKVQLIAAAAQ
jgi:hypothetical protein